MTRQEQLELKPKQEVELQPEPQKPGLKVKTNIKAGQDEEEVEA